MWQLTAGQRACEELSRPVGAHLARLAAAKAFHELQHVGELLLGDVKVCVEALRGAPKGEEKPWEKKAAAAAVAEATRAGGPSIRV